MLVVLMALLGGTSLALQNSWVQTRLTQLVARNLSKRLDTKITVGRVDIGFFNKLHLEDVLIEDLNNDTLLYSHQITAKIDTLRLRKQYISINELKFTNNKINISRDSANSYNFSFILNAFGQNKQTDTLNLWKVHCNRFDFNELDIKYSNAVSQKYSNILAHNLNLDISNFYSVPDSLTFNLNHLSANDGKNLVLKEASANIMVRDGKVAISKFNLKSKHSTIEDTQLDLQLYLPDDSMNVPFDLNLRITKSKISFRELGELIPSLKGMDQTIDLSGLIYGNLNDLKGKNIVFKTGEHTKGVLDFYVNDITNMENMYLFLDLKQSATSFEDISKFRLPNKSSTRHIEFPESFYEAGILRFNGNFSGFLSDFVTFGTLQSDMGTLTTDILVMPDKNGALYYRGNLATEDFKLGQLFNKNTIGKITFSGSADGSYNEKRQSISGVFKGDINKIDLNSYTYKNVKFDGILHEKMFDGLLSINDPNLKFTFLGEFDLNRQIPRFDFNMDVSRAKLAALNLGSKFPNAELAFKMVANFNGDKIDNLDGKISIKKGLYKNRNGELNFNGLELYAVNKTNEHALTINSDLLDLSIDGKYNFFSLNHTFKKIMHHYIPSLNYEEGAVYSANNFTYKINVKQLNQAAQIFIPGLKFEKPFLLYGQVDSPNNIFELRGSIPGIIYKDIWARNIFIGNQPINSLYASKFRINEILHRNGMKLYNFTIDSKIGDNKLNNIISWSNFDELTYSGALRTETVFSRSDNNKNQHIEIKGFPSQIYVADTLWSVAPFEAIIDSNSFAISNLTVKHGKQQIEASGKLVNGKTDGTNVKLSNIDLSYLDKYLNRNIQMEGIVNGEFSVANVFDKPVVLSNLLIDKFKFKKQDIGNISLISQWNSLQSTIDSELKITRNNHESLKTFGYFKPSTKELKYFTEIDSLSLIVLEAFMGTNFSDFKGYGTGKVDIDGSTDKLLLNGGVFAADAGLTVNATQVPYHLNDTIFFRNDTIGFENITFYDRNNNSGIFSGTIQHTNFQNMNFDLNMHSEKIEALNTTQRDNEQFYGTIFAKGSLDITGGWGAISLNSSVTTLPNTDVRISMESESTIEQYDFIEFVTEEKPESNDFFSETEQKKQSELDMTFTVQATPEAKVQIIYNSQVGDIIKAQGDGILLFEMDKEGNISLSGNYSPTKGDYLFTLENVINKRFSIEQGGTIIWSGDPYNAVIDLNAIYKLKASLYDLLPNRFENKSQTQRIPVECIINLKDELINPTIGFNINFPSVDEPIRDELSQFFKTEEEMNKQILSLIVMGKFYTPEYMRGTYEAQTTNMVGTTASELLSNQLSNWLSQISSSWDIGLNYRPGTQVSNDEIEVALSTQIFNDRVTLNGNIANNTNEYSMNSSSSQIVGDFEMSVKLVPSGKIQLKAYNRSNDNLIYETAPYTQGIGLSFKEEYNTIDELFQKLARIFKKKKDKINQ